MLSSGCDARECRMLLPEGVRIGEHVTCPSLGSPDGVALNSEACHVSSGAAKGVRQAYLPPCVKVHIYNIRSSVSLFNDREILWLVMMPLGGGRAIITLRATDRDRGRSRGCQRSWKVTCHHSCPFTLQVAERRPWQAVGMTCKTCLFQSTI